MKCRTATLLLALMMALVLFAGACGDDDDDNDNNDSADDDDDDNDTGDDDTTDDDTGDDDTTDDDTGDDDTVGPWDNLSDELGAGEVRAGVITAADELIGGPRARGMLGDYKLYNSRVEFIVRAPENPGVGWIPYGGNLVDADRARPASEEGADSLWAMEQALGLLRGFMAQEAEVVSDGHDGAAVVRMTGKDAGIDIVDHLVPTWDYNLTITTEYTLPADADYLIIKTTLKNNTDKKKTVFLADIALWGDEGKIFTPRAGYNLGDADLLANLRWVGGISRLGLPVSYAVATLSPGRRMYVPYIDGDILPLIDGLLKIEPQGEASIGRMFIVGDGDTRLIHETIDAFDGNTDYGTLNGTLHVPTGDDPTTVEIIVQDKSRPDDSNYVGVAKPDATGAFTLQLPPDRYTLYATGKGRVDSATVTIEITAGNESTADLTIDEPGYFSFDVTDGDGANIPCMFIFQNGFNQPRAAGIVHRVWTATGEGVEPVAAGEYTVTVTRGYEYEIDTMNVTIAAGDTADFATSIERVVDTTGYMSSDFHFHSERSVDSQAILPQRVIEAMAEGLEMPVITDHDTASDFSGCVDDLGANDLIKFVSGMEISPVWGHTNVWPLSPPATADDYYPVRLAEYDDEGNFVSRLTNLELWTIAREELGAQIVKINHPRSDSSGWFNTVGYDPTVGVSSANPNIWSDQFDAIEVWNGGTIGHGDNMLTFVDWFSFLDQGYTYTMLGGSDSHREGSMLGNPRDMFAMPTDDPGDADVQDMVDSVLASRSLSCNGPFVEFSIGDQTIGGFVTGVDGTVDLDIVIQAPSWIDVNFVRVYSNGGEIIAEQAVTGVGVVRFDDAIPVTSTEDRYFVVAAGHSTATLAPYLSGEPVFTVTNPIWVDFDGNGEFDAPGL